MPYHRTSTSLLVSLCTMFFTQAPLRADDSGGTPITPEQIAGWIDQLDAEAFATREEATKALIAADVAALPDVARSAASDVQEVRTRAFRVLAALARVDDPRTVAAVEKTVAALAEFEAAPIAEAARRITVDIRDRRQSTAVVRLTAGGLIVTRDGAGQYTSISNNPGLNSEFVSSKWNEIEDDVLADLVFLPDVTFVQLRDSGIGDAGLAHVAQLPAITNLDVNGTNVTDDGLAVLAGMPTLRYFTLESPHVTGKGLVHLRKATGLTGLQFTGKTANDDWLAAVEPLREIGSLELNGTSVTGDGLAAIAKWSKLNEVFLNNNATLDDAGLPYLADKTLLTWVELTHTAVTQDGFDAHLRQLPNVKRWGLPKGVEAPAASNETPK